MSESFEDDGPWTHYQGSGNHSSSNNSTTGADKKGKNVRFGVLELAIFIGIWVVMLIAYKVYNHSSQKSKEGPFLP